MTAVQEQINTKVNQSNFIHNKITNLFTAAEHKYQKDLKFPSISITEKPVKDRQDNVLYLLHEDLDSKKFESILNRKIITLITIQLFGKNFKSHERRILKQKLGILSKLRNPEKYKSWDWSLRDAVLARKYKCSRERVGQVREILGK